MSKKIIHKAIIDIFPLSMAVIPWGILCGTLAIDAGLNFWQAQAMSMFVFAGAAQLSATTLISAGAGWVSVASSVLAISSRHILYSIDLRKDVYKLPLKLRVPLAFFLTDEMYAVSKVYVQKYGVFSPLYSLSAGIFFYLVWNVATFVGIIMGQKLGHLEKLGLDFAVVAVFIAITAVNLRELSMIVTAIVSALAAIYFKSIYPDSYVIIASLLGMLAGYLVTRIAK